MNKIKQRGFTLIELLVVITIIGLLSTLALISLNSARIKARDARRLSDIKQIQTALALYYNDKMVYPQNDTGNFITLGDANHNILCDTDDGFEGSRSACGTDPNIYMELVPADPGNYNYKYWINDGSGSYDYQKDYCIEFTIEGKIANFEAGVCHATPGGIICNDTGC